MFSTTVAIVVSFYVVEILAVDVSCATPHNGSPIENCCDLGFREHTFSLAVNHANIYKFKNFCNKNCSTYPTYIWIL